MSMLGDNYDKRFLTMMNDIDAIKKDVAEVKVDIEKLRRWHLSMDTFIKQIDKLVDLDKALCEYAEWTGRMGARIAALETHVHGIKNEYDS